MTGVDRRRRWSVEDKLKIVRAVDDHRAVRLPVWRVAMMDVCRSQIYQWRPAFRWGWLGADEKVIDFYPVEICDDPPIVAYPVARSSA